MRGVLLVAAAALMLSGCATRSFSISSLPDETPAADNAAAVSRTAAMMAANASAMSGAGVPAAGATGAANGGAGGSPSESANGGASPGQAAPANQEDQNAFIPLTLADAPSMYTYDPWERLNRFTYRFNARFDENVFLPVANGYRRVPRPIRAGVHNFFNNLSEVKSTANYVLQLRFGGGIHSLGRFVINSTLGIGGLFDVATKLKVTGEPTGFATTLSKWGVHPGPYLVIPLLGPSTLRDGIGYLGDYGIEYGINLADLYRGYQSWALSVVSAVDTRANVGFRYYATDSPFEYETIRFLYVRKELIEDEALHAKGRRRPRDPHAPAGQ